MPFRAFPPKQGGPVLSCHRFSGFEAGYRPLPLQTHVSRACSSPALPFSGFALTDILDNPAKIVQQPSGPWGIFGNRASRESVFSRAVDTGRFQDFRSEFRMELD